MRICRKTSVFEKKLKKIWIGFLLVFLNSNITSSILSFGGLKLLRDQLLNKSWLSRFHFAVWFFVSEVALLCTSNSQLLTDVYNHRFWCRFRQQKFFPIESAVCSENFAVLKLVIGLLNICTKMSLQLGNLKHIFWIEFATEWVFSQKRLLLANVKLTLHSCHFAVRARPRKQYLISIVFEFEIVDVNFFNSELLFRKSFFYVDA